MSFEWLAMVDMAKDISTTNKQNEYSDSFSAVTDPASFLYNQGYLGQTPRDKRRQELEDREYRLRERNIKISEALARIQLEEYYRKKNWQDRFMRAMAFGGVK